jgi:hypothetical protein
MMMKKVVSINNRRFLGAYDYAQKSERIPEDIFFFSGVIFSMALPQGIYSVYGGFISLIAFVGSALAGSLWGLVRYRRLPRRIISCVDMGTMPQAPKSKDINQKLAA